MIAGFVGIKAVVTRVLSHITRSRWGRAISSHHFSCIPIPFYIYKEQDYIYKEQAQHGNMILWSIQMAVARFLQMIKVNETL